MRSDFPQKKLIIAVIEKDGSILMRKKPAGSPPYKETWYLFGCEPIADQEDSITLKNYLKKELGIDVEVCNRSIPSDSEIKNDHDGILKEFTYVNLLCTYVSGQPRVPTGAEQIEWIPEATFSHYDLVPPSVKLLKTLGLNR